MSFPNEIARSIKIDAPVVYQAMGTLRQRGRGRILIGLLVCIALSLLLCESGLRSYGVLDVPVYQTDDEIGYELVPSQSGVFLGKNHWVINDRGMNVGSDFDGTGSSDLLLAGDSIVWGGNPYDQKDRLGDQLQVACPIYRVWPICAGSWSIENVDVWLDRNHETLSDIEIVVWVLNKADMKQASKWSSELTHPRGKPKSALWQAANKAIFPRIRGWLLTFGSTAKASDPVDNFEIDPGTQAIFAERTRSIVEDGKKLLIVLYPDRDQWNRNEEAISQWNQFTTAVKEALPPEARTLDILESEQWGDELYNDGIHPNVAGFRQLAGLIAENLTTQDVDSE